MDDDRCRYQETGRTRLSLPGLLTVMALGALLVFIGFIFTRHLVDFPVYYSAGRSLIGGRTDLYAPDFALGPTMDYRYPPLFLTSLIPLWHLPYGSAAYLWYFLGIVAIMACCWAVSRALLRNGGRPEPESLAGPMLSQQRWNLDRTTVRTMAVALIGVAQYYVMALHYGNAQLLVTALVLLALVLAVRQWNWAPATLLALAISIKVTPALFLIYFAVKRRWSLLMITGAMLVVLNLAPAMYFGYSKNVELIGTWYRHVLVDQEGHEINGPINLSLKGQMVRTLTLVDYQQRLDGDTRYPAVNLAEYSYRDISKLWLPLDVFVLLLGLGFILWLDLSDESGPCLVRTASVARCVDTETGSRAEAYHARPRTDVRPAHGAKDAVAKATLQIGVMTCLMLLAEPLTSKIFFVALIWPLAALWDDVLRSHHKTPRLLRWGAGAVVITNVVLPLLPGRSVQRFLLVVGADFYLTCLILVLLVWSLLAARRIAPD